MLRKIRHLNIVWSIWSCTSAFLCKFVYRILIKIIILLKIYINIYHTTIGKIIKLGRMSPLYICTLSLNKNKFNKFCRREKLLNY